VIFDIVLVNFGIRAIRRGTWREFSALKEEPPPDESQAMCEDGEEQGSHRNTEGCLPRSGRQNKCPHTPALTLLAEC
jgi:hypothetical protein